MWIKESSQSREAKGKINIRKLDVLSVDFEDEVGNDVTRDSQDGETEVVLPPVERIKIVGGEDLVALDGNNSARCKSCDTNATILKLILRDHSKSLPSSRRSCCTCKDLCIAITTLCGC